MEQLLVESSEQYDEILDLTSFVVNGIAYSSDGYRAFFASIGPALAERILATYRTDYRKPRVRHIESIAADMSEGNWKLDGSPIRINELNELADGQHRLTAVIKSGTHQEFLIVDRLPVSTYDTMDTNALTRTYIDVLRRRGYTNQPPRAALAKLIWNWDHLNTLDSRQSMSIAKLDSVHENPEYKDRITWAIHNAANLDRKIHAKRSIISLALFVLGAIDQTSIKELLHAIALHEGLYRGTPAYALMNRFENDHNSDREKYRTHDDTMYYIIRAWKAYYQNTMRPANDQIVVGNNINLPAAGVTVRSLKEMLEMS